MLDDVIKLLTASKEVVRFIFISTSRVTSQYKLAIMLCPRLLISVDIVLLVLITLSWTISE